MLKRLWRLAPILVLLAAVRAQQPASASRPAADLEIGKWRANFEIVQEDQAIKADDKGIYHLKPKPFGIHVTGDIDRLGIYASAGNGLAKGLTETKRPVIRLGGTGGADDVGLLFDNPKACLREWAETKPLMDDEFEKLQKVLTDRFKQTPDVIDSTFQVMDHYAPDGSRHYVFPVTQIINAPGTVILLDKDGKPIDRPDAVNTDWAAVKELYVTLVIQDEVLKDMFDEVHWRTLHMQFDAK